MGVQSVLLIVAAIGLVLAVGASVILQFKDYAPPAAKTSLIAGLALGLSSIGGFIAAQLS